MISIMPAFRNRRKGLMHAPQEVSQWTVPEPLSRLRTVSVKNGAHRLGSNDPNSSSCDNAFLIKSKGKLIKK